MSDPVSSTTERTSGAPKRVSMIVANPGILELTGWLIGFWARSSPTRGTSCARQATT